jgi:hypothetical protein
LTILLAAAAIVYLEPQPTQSNVNVIHTLDSYTTANPDLPDTVPTFLQLGQVGRLTDSGTVEYLYLSTRDIMCSESLEAHSVEVAEFFRRSRPGSDVDVAFATEWLATARDGGQLGNCIVAAGRSDYTASEIVAYQFSGAALAQSYVRAVVNALLVVFGWSLVVVNLYSRGLIYVVFGGRQHE